MVYLPDKPTEHFKSFSCPILRLHDSHVSIPMFSPHTWSAAMQPVQGGNIPTPSTGVVEVKLAFKDGGAHDMQAQYEQIRERIQQAVEVSGSGSSGADVSNVNLEDLPAYQEESDGPLISATTAAVVQQSVPTAQQQLEGNVAGVEAVNGGTRAMVSDTTLNHPDEPPPGYEETQMAGLQSEAERRLNGQE
jgi:DNA uptake protein ComE-like DNA-binding protein